MRIDLVLTGGLRRGAGVATCCGAIALLVLCAPAARGSYAGTLDPSFGNGGVTVAQPVSGSPSFADSLALQSDGKIVVGGYASSDPTNGAAPSTALVARLLPDGALDPRFGDGGHVALSNVQGFAPSSVPYDEQPPPPVRVKVLVAASGHVLVLGSQLIGLNSDGSLDTSFGSSGLASLPAGFSPAGMALAPGGLIDIVGDMMLASRTVGAIVRVTAEGRMDPTFGTAGDGVVTLPALDDLKGRPLRAVDYRGIAVSGDGAITVAGVGGATTEETIPSRDGLLARLTASGTLDAAFGSGGQTVVERHGGIPSFDSFDPNALLLTGNEHALVGATTCAKFGRCFPNLLDFPATGSGVILPNEGSGGCMPSYCQQRLALTSLPDGGVLGGVWEGDLLLQRFDAGLKPVADFGSSEEGVDASSGPGAVAQLPAGSEAVGNMLVLADGEIVVAGSAPAPGGSGGIFVARLFGLSPAPPARLSIPRQRARSAAGVVSVLVDCHPYVSCRGLGKLQVRSTASHGGTRRWVLAGSGPFDIAADGPGPVVMALTPAGSSLLKRKKTADVRLTLALHGARSLITWIRVARPAPPPAVRRAVPGALVPVAGDITAFESDGRRYVAFEQGAVVYGLDTRTERRYASRIPKQCLKDAAESLRGMSFPMVLLSCESGSVLVNVRTGHSRALPNPAPGVREEWPGIGRVWAGPGRAPSCPNFYVCNEYLDWHTGAVRRIDSPPTPPTPTGTLNEVVARNLDSPGLAAVSPCAPLQPSNLEDSLLAYPRLYEPPYVIYGQAVDPMNGNPMNSAPDAPAGLVLGRCGVTTPVVLDTTAVQIDPRSDLPGDQLGAGIVSWYSPPSATVHVYDIAQHRSLDWVAPGARSEFSSPAAVAHTGHAVIVATASHQLCLERECKTDAWTLYQVKLP